METFGITMTAEAAGPANWQGIDSNKWDVELRRGDGFVMRLPFYRGVGIPGEPTLTDVLDCLQSESSILINEELDDVLGDMPYSKARAMADAIERQTNDLRRLLGDDFDAFLGEEYDG
jgi:hypothetical protein